MEKQGLSMKAENKRAVTKRQQTALTTEEVECKLRQYDILSTRKLHYGNLFWSATGLFFAVSALLVNALKDAEPSSARLLLCGAALVTLYALVFSIRVAEIESKYEDLLGQLEVDLSLLSAPKSRTVGTRLLTIVLLASGLAAMIIGALVI